MSDDQVLLVRGDGLEKNCWLIVLVGGREVVLRGKKKKVEKIKLSIGFRTVFVSVGGSVGPHSGSHLV